MAKQLNPLENDSLVWRSKGYIVDATAGECTVVSFRPHPNTKAVLFRITHSSTFIPDTGEYWKYYVDFRMNDIGTVGQGEIKSL